MKETDAWGTLNETNGEWIGMIRHLIDGEADLTVPIAADIPIRRTAVDFTFCTAIFEYGALFRKPSFSRSEMALAKPFTKSLWLATFIWVFAMTAIMHALQSRRGSKLIDWIMYPAATICLKSSEFCVSTEKVELRIMVVTGVFVGFVLNAVYCAILYSFLSLPAKGSWEIAYKQYVFGVRDEDMFLFEQKIQVIRLPEQILCTTSVIQLICNIIGDGPNYFRVLCHQNFCRTIKLDHQCMQIQEVRKQSKRYWMEL